jgi:hypothetical protein
MIISGHADHIPTVGTNAVSDKTTGVQGSWRCRSKPALPRLPEQPQAVEDHQQRSPQAMAPQREAKPRKVAHTKRALVGGLDRGVAPNHRADGGRPLEAPLTDPACPAHPSGHPPKHRLLALRDRPSVQPFPPDPGPDKRRDEGDGHSEPHDGGGVDPREPFHPLLRRGALGPSVLPPSG